MNHGPYSPYNAISGQLIGQTFSTNLEDDDAAAKFAAQNTPAGCAMYAGAIPDPASQMIDVASGELIARGACPITSAVAAHVVTLSGVPAGAAYVITGDATLSGTADASGTLALTFGAAGTYSVLIPCFPLLDYLGSFTL
jgi:hypothetical protein